MFLIKLRICSVWSLDRYAKSPSLYAVELMNEPFSPGVTLDSLIKYYEAGYAAVRRHSSTAFVVLSNRLGRPMQPRELFHMASRLRGSVIDLHYYNLYEDMFHNMTVQQNIDFVYHNRSTQLNLVTTSNGPLTFVGKKDQSPAIAWILIRYCFYENNCELKVDDYLIFQANGWLSG